MEIIEGFLFYQDAREGLPKSWKQPSLEEKEVHPGASLLKIIVRRVGRFVGVR